MAIAMGFPRIFPEHPFIANETKFRKPVKFCMFLFKALVYVLPIFLSLAVALLRFQAWPELYFCRLFTQFQ
jgi:hypothetical protein